MYRIRKAIRFTHNRVSSGYHGTASVLSFNHDGLEIARVRTRRRFLPFWHILIFMYLVLLIRLMVISDIGPTGYAGRMEEMKNGNILERVAASVMQLDPLSRWAATEFRGKLKQLDIM